MSSFGVLFFDIASIALICRCFRTDQQPLILLEKFDFLLFVLTTSFRLPRLHIQPSHLNRFPPSFALQFILDVSRAWQIASPLQINLGRAMLGQTEVTIAQTTSWKVSFQAGTASFGILRRINHSISLLQIFVIVGLLFVILLLFLVRIFMDNSIAVMVNWRFWLGVSRAHIFIIGRVFGEFGANQLVAIRGLRIVNVTIERGSCGVRLAVIFFGFSRFFHWFWHIWGVFWIMLAIWSIFKGRWLTVLSSWQVVFSFLFELRRRLSFVLLVWTSLQSGHKGRTRLGVHIVCSSQGSLGSIWRYIWLTRRPITTYFHRSRLIIVTVGCFGSRCRIALLRLWIWSCGDGGSARICRTQLHCICRSSETVCSFRPFLSLFTLHALLGFLLFKGSFLG